MLSADDSLHCNSKGYKGISFIGDIKYRNALLHTFLNRLMLTQTLKQRLIKLKHNMKTVEEALLLWGLNYFTLMMTNRFAYIVIDINLGITCCHLQRLLAGGTHPLWLAG